MSATEIHVAITTPYIVSTSELFVLLHCSCLMSSNPLCQIEHSPLLKEYAVQEQLFRQNCAQFLMLVESSTFRAFLGGRTHGNV